MKILIIGNGFDIAHTLNTRYSDFQSFVERFETEYERKNAIPEDALFRAAIGNPHGRAIARLELLCMDDMLHNEPKMGDFFHHCVSDNLLLDYFKSRSFAPGYRWMDYEAEIEKLILLIDSSVGSGSIDRQVESGLSQIVDDFVIKKTINPETSNLSMENEVFSYRLLLSRLNDDLIRLTNALELYMSRYVQDYNWRDDSSHRDRSKYKPFSCFRDVDKLLNFNYTDTFMRQYNRDVDCCYVHGKAQIKLKELYSAIRDGHTVKRDPSIVLGISDENEDGEIKFHAPESLYYDFQKFMLREQHGDKHWKEWIKDKSEIFEVHVVGHSLTYSDKDILDSFLLLPETNPGSTVKIYYLDADSKKDLQKNLVKMIGKGEFKELSRIGIEYLPVGDIIRGRL